MKKILKMTALLLAGLLTVSFAGCSQQKPADGDAPSASATESAAPSAESAAPAAESATPEPQKPTWEVVNDVKVDHMTNYEGFLNESVGFTVGYAGEIHYTTDGGKTWPRGDNKSMCRFSLDIVNENLAIAGGNGNEIRKTTDGGKTWSGLTNFVGGGLHYHICFVDENNGWIATATKLASTSDGGMTWNPIENPDGEKIIQAVFLRTPSEGYFLTPNGMLYTTKDGGLSWSKQDLDFVQFGVADVNQKSGYLDWKTCPVAEINFVDENKGTIALVGLVPGAGYKSWVMETEDGGATWKTEEIKPAEDFKPSTVYLSKDGQYITLSSMKKRLIVLKKAAP